MTVLVAVVDERVLDVAEATMLGYDARVICALDGDATIPVKVVVNLHA